MIEYYYVTFVIRKIGGEFFECDSTAIRGDPVDFLIKVRELSKTRYEEIHIVSWIPCTAGQYAKLRKKGE